MHTRKRLLSMLLLRIYHWKYAIILLTMTIYALPYTSAAAPSPLFVSPNDSAVNL